MTKREMIHTLIDKLLDIEENSQKGVSFSYISLIGMDFHFTTRQEAHSDWVGTRTDCYFKKGWNAETQFLKALEAIETVNNTPDVEPKLSFTLDESKARELGLIS